MIWIIICSYNIILYAWVQITHSCSSCIGSCSIKKKKKSVNIIDIHEQDQITRSWPTNQINNCNVYFYIISIMGSNRKTRATPPGDRYYNSHRWDIWKERLGWCRRKPGGCVGKTNRKIRQLFLDIVCRSLYIVFYFIVDGKWSRMCDQKIELFGRFQDDARDR